MAGKSPLLRSDEAGVGDARRLLVGGRVEDVEYFPYGEDGWPNGSASSSAFHDASHGVRLRLDPQGAAGVFWAMEYNCHGLLVEATTELRSDWAVNVATVATVPPWPDIVGQQVSQVRAMWHESEADVPEALFAIELTFERQNVIISLGESPRPNDAAPASGVTYMPNSVVAIFDEHVFNAYIAQGDPSWVRSDWVSL
jgi:hypothetical protein